ncbi:hypothetical protein [Myxosarcina sp. GI1]|uniref:hypothetical protein n=1 Tax=Myxosarcina sp. GI1 TaxID=1541065 RepID=UPI00055F6FBC|nr:hypothetical protein [Myxosarcina sp. GI1]
MDFNLKQTFHNFSIMASSAISPKGRARRSLEGMMFSRQFMPLLKPSVTPVISFAIVDCESKSSDSDSAQSAIASDLFECIL